MPKKDSEILEETRHAPKCPSCLCPRVSASSDGRMMSCIECGHAWMGSDWPLNEQERTPPTFNGRE